LGGYLTGVEKEGIKREKEGIASLGGGSVSTPSPIHHLIRKIQTRSDSCRPHGRLRPPLRSCFASPTQLRFVEARKEGRGCPSHPAPALQRHSKSLAFSYSHVGVIGSYRSFLSSREICQTKIIKQLKKTYTTLLPQGFAVTPSPCGSWGDIGHFFLSVNYQRKDT
jgi:hypothetical protein